MVRFSHNSRRTDQYMSLAAGVAPAAIPFTRRLDSGITFD
jgi:hypothetical protein